jgi:hypothetical protein
MNIKLNDVQGGTIDSTLGTPQNILNKGKMGQNFDSSKSLNENLQNSQQLQSKQFVSTDSNAIQTVMENKSKQFKFDSGIVMGRIDMPINTKIGLYWHFKNTDSLDSFIDSVAKFIAISGNTLTEKDKSLLEKQYSKVIKK